MNTVCANCQALNRIPDDRMEDGAKCGRCGHELFDGDVINATGATLDKLLKDDLPVVIDFWAPWCGPCKAMSPIVEQIGKEMQGQARVLKIDVDKNQAVAAQYQIQAVPTFMIFKKGEMVWRQPGGADKMTIMNQLRKFI